jgi:hypothetical protein
MINGIAGGFSILKSAAILLSMFRSTSIPLLFLLLLCR